MHEEERERERRKEHLHFIPRGFFFERRIPLTLKGTSRGSSSSSSRISPSSRMKLRNAILESLPFEILILSVEIVLRRQIFPFSLSLSFQSSCLLLWRLLRAGDISVFVFPSSFFLNTKVWQGHAYFWYPSAFQIFLVKIFPFWSHSEIPNTF